MTRLDHINISAPMPLLEQEKAFLCKVLNLQVGERPGFKKGGYWLYSGGQALVHLSESERHVAHDIPGHLDHVAFVMDELPALLTVLAELDITFQQNYLADRQLTQVFFHSPAGVRIEVGIAD